MRNTRVSVSKYLEIYSTSWKELNQWNRSRSEYKSETIATTWLISFRKIKSQSEGAARLLKLWGCLSNQDLWYGLLQQGLNQTPYWFQDIIKTELHFLETIQVLLDYSMVEGSENSDSYYMHPVVHDWIREYINQDDDLEFSAIAMGCIGSAVVDSDESEYWLVNRRLVPHATQSARRWFGGTSGLSSLRLSLPQFLWLQIGIHQLGSLFFDQDELDLAQQSYEHTLKAFEQGLDGLEGFSGPGDDLLLDIYNNLGLVYLRKNKLHMAEDMFHKALKQGPEPNYEIGTRDTMCNLGLVLKRHGRFEDAEQLYLHSLRIVEENYPSKHPLLPDMVSNLGFVYHEQGKLDEAERAYLRAISGYDAIWVNEHPSTLKTVSSLGDLYKEQGKLQNAKEMFTRAAEGYKNVYGLESNTTRDMISCLEEVSRAEPEEQ